MIKTIYWKFSVILGVGLIFLCIGCGDMETYYPSYQDAEQDGLFRKGWLPPILPPSAKEFYIRTDLDLNESRGRFSLDKQGMEIFLEKVKKMQGKNSVFQYSSHGSIWTFYTASNGQITYKMVPQKTIPQSQLP